MLSIRAANWACSPPPCVQVHDARVEFCGQTGEFLTTERQVSQASTNTNIKAYPGSGAKAASGRVTVEKGWQSVKVRFNLQGLAPGSRGGVHIMDGKSCSSKGAIGGQLFTNVDDKNKARLLHGDFYTQTVHSDVFKAGA